MPESPIRSFQDVLAAAVADIAEHGYDSVERIDGWKRELELAAARQAGDPERNAQLLRDALAAIYKRSVDDLDLLRHHAGDVPRFTIEKVKPQLRAELDRRLRAAANLVKGGQKEAVDKVMRRWEGWATSVPAGGVPGEKRAEVKASVGKSLKQLPFDQRRILTDQGHKMVAALSEIVASDGGAIAGRWRSNWRQAGYDYREDHKERDDKVYLIRDSWAHRAGLVRKSGQPYYDEITAAGQEPFCRCYVVWIYSLRDLPEDMLTRDGRRKLVEVGQHTNATRAFARADAAPAKTFPHAFSSPQFHLDVARAVLNADRLDYLRHVRRIDIVEDSDEWHAQEDDGAVQLEAKFFGLPAVEQAHVLLHEIGHAGQRGDPRAWAAFRAAHEGRLSAFEAMANRAHLEDYRRRGWVDGGLSPEVFAESYARFCLGMPLPSHLADFWRSRVTGLLAPQDARYMPWWPNKITRCRRCSMFVPGLDPRRNTCTAVAGDIAMNGHCKLFEISGARLDAAEDDPPPKVGYAAHLMRLDRLQLEAARIREETS